MSKIVVFIYLLIIWILRAIKGIFIEALESFQIDIFLNSRESPQSTFRRKHLL